MTVLSSKKPSNNARDCSSNSQATSTVPSSSSQPSSIARPRLSRDDEHARASNTNENTTENSASVTSSSQLITTTTLTDLSSSSSSSSTPSMSPSGNGSTQSKQKTSYSSYQSQPSNRPVTISRRQRRSKCPTSSNSDSSNDDSLDENPPGDQLVNNVSKSVHAKHVHTTDQCNSEDEYESSEKKYNRSNLSEEEITFARTLKEKKGLIIKPVKEDGACLFRAVADQVFGDEEMHGAVRQHCLDYIVKNADFFRAYITEDFDRYVERKRRENCHGNHIEMIALSEIYNRPIEVYEYSLEPINVVHGMYKTDNEPIRLSYHCSVHYNSIIDPWRPTAGHGLGLPDLQPGHAQESLIVTALRESEDTHIDQTLLEEQLVSTDWEATQEELIKQITRDSYREWLCERDPQVKENRTLPTIDSCFTTSNETSNLGSASKPSLPLKLDDRTDGQFALPFHYQLLNDDDVDDEDALMQQVLAMSQMEYVENLQKQSSTSDDNN